MNEKVKFRIPFPENWCRRSLTESAVKCHELSAIAAQPSRCPINPVINFIIDPGECLEHLEPQRIVAVAFRQIVFQDVKGEREQMACFSGLGFQARRPALSTSDHPSSQIVKHKCDFHFRRGAF